MIIQVEKSTKRKRTRSETSLDFMKLDLAKSNALLESILEVSLAGYWIWNIKENNNIYLSPAFKKMFGYEDHELNTGDPNIWQKLMHPEDVPTAYRLMEKHFQSKGEIPYENEVRYYHKNGSIIWVYCKGRVIEFDEFDNPLRVVGCHIDITGLKRAKKVQLIAAEMELKIKELEELAFVASHDLQSPLNAVLGLTALLAHQYEDALGGPGTECIRQIRVSVLHMSELIQEMLQYSHLGKDDVMSNLDCNEIVKDVMSELNEKITESECQILVDNLPHINGYKRSIHLLFKNLIDNAIKFQNMFFIPKVSISAVRQEEGWMFRISDNGIGIANEYHKTIFKLFQRLHSKRDFEGVGIGLAQCKKIVEVLHKGKIWVESAPGKGSTFIFTIP